MLIFCGVHDVRRKELVHNLGEVGFTWSGGSLREKAEMFLYPKEGGMAVGHFLLYLWDWYAKEGWLNDDRRSVGR